MRMAGEIAVTSPSRDIAAAKRNFESALAIARAKKAKSWELRAATSLARLWYDVGRHAEARTLLARLQAEFSEGFDTRDFIEAGAELRALER